jgi:hypothetical protein
MREFSHVSILQKNRLFDSRRLVNGYLAGYGTLKDLRAEIDSYGLSDTGRSQLLSVIKASQCIPCRR